jgi:O-antigen chain-terminating methyltransferase
MIEKFVRDLPELYQPVFGHPELSDTASRLSNDRLKQIEQIYLSLARLLKRPLKVLDLGCAQGFFSLSLAKLGAHVHGVDYLDKNIALCHALASENPNFKISFARGSIEELIPSFEVDQYDLVLGLSVFHHLVHAHGAKAVKILLERLANISGALVLEMALQSEPLYWASSQPRDPQELINDIGFVHLVTHHDTHLAEIPRPLYIASSRYWIFNGLAGKFDSWSFDPHILSRGVHQFSRRYFFSNDQIVKLYQFNHFLGEANRSEQGKELDFLQYPPNGFAVPNLIVHGRHETEAWLCMQKFPGRLLVDLICEGVIFDRYKVLLEVLKQLTKLEAAGLYHNDVRTWNVLFDEESGSIHLIDYGSISNVSEDCVWPYNLFLAFFIFVREVVEGISDPPTLLRTPSISPYGLPEPYCTWASKFWLTPMSKWSFHSLYQALLELPLAVDKKSAGDWEPLSYWMQAIEKAIQIQTKHISDTETHNHELILQAQLKAQQAESIAHQSELKAQQAESIAHQSELKAQQAESLAQIAEIKAQQAEVASLDLAAQLKAVYRSKSWRLTAPLRKTGQAVNTFSKVPKDLKLALKGKIKLLLAHASLYVNRRPKLRHAVLGVLARFPTVKARIKVATINRSFPQKTARIATIDLKNLTPRTRQIYAELKAAIECQQKERR